MRLNNADKDLARRSDVATRVRTARVAPTIQAQAAATTIRDSATAEGQTAVADCDAEAAVAEQFVALAADPDAGVRMQLAISLGEWGDPRAGVALQKLETMYFGEGFPERWRDDTKLVVQFAAVGQKTLRARYAD